MSLPVAFLNFAADTVVCAQPCLLNAVCLLTATTGGSVTLYEGQDADSGRKVGRFESTADNSLFIAFPHAPFLARGIFVDVGDTVTEVTIFFTLLPIGAEKPAE